MQSQPLRIGVSAWALLLLLALLWGGSFFFIEIALRDLPIFTIVLGRVGIAALFLLTYLLARGEQIPLTPHAIGEFLLLGLLRAALPISLIPIMALLLGVVILGEPIQPQAYAGLGLILLGLAAVQFGAVDLRTPSATARAALAQRAVDNE